MATTVAVSNMDVPFDSAQKERTLDVFYTHDGTKLYVKNGVLTEERIVWDYSEFVGNDYCPDPPIVDASVAVDQNTRSSKAALKHYNHEHQTNYELVDPISSNGFICEGLGYHCNFKASESSRGDSSAKLFFAEVMIVGYEDGEIYSVTVCCPLEDGESTPCCNVSCRTILHPKNVALKGS